MMYLSMTGGRSANDRRATSSRITPDRVKKKITVVLVDDHALVRRGFRLILEDEADMKVVGEAGDGIKGVEIARELRPAVVLMDCSLPGMDGLVAAGHIAKSCPQTAVLMLSMHSEGSRVRQAASVGARGYILKNAVGVELVSAIRRVVAGEAVFDQELLKPELPEPRKPSVLSARELEVLQLIVNGKTNREIASQLNLSANTIASHRANIMQTLRIDKTAELVVYAIRNGLANIL